MRYRSRVLDTLFGRFEVKAPRIRGCACNAKSDVVLGGPLSALAHFFPDRSTPELRRLHAELGARHSFREAARILETFLPCAKQVNTSVRNRLGKVAGEICDSEQTEPLVSSLSLHHSGSNVALSGAPNIWNFEGDMLAKAKRGIFLRLHILGRQCDLSGLRPLRVWLHLHPSIRRKKCARAMSDIPATQLCCNQVEMSPGLQSSIRVDQA